MSKIFGNVTNLAKGKANEFCIRVGQIEDYTLVYRNTSFQPWVVAWRFCNKGNDSYWEQGHYFETFEEAVAYMLYKQRPDTVLSTAMNICDERDRSDISELLAELVMKGED